jgi:hypothetical protein
MHVDRQRHSPAFDDCEKDRHKLGTVRQAYRNPIADHQA